MPIVIDPVKPFKQPPHRGKIVKGGGVREADDWSNVEIHCKHSDTGHLIAHRHTLDDKVVIEIHDSLHPSGEYDLENCRMECYELDSHERLELALYLLSTVNFK